MAIYLPIIIMAWGCLLLFYKNYIVYYNVVDYCGVFIEK